MHHIGYDDGELRLTRCGYLHYTQQLGIPAARPLYQAVVMWVESYHRIISGRRQKQRGMYRLASLMHVNRKILSMYGTITSGLRRCKTGSATNTCTVAATNTCTIVAATIVAATSTCATYM